MGDKISNAMEAEHACEGFATIPCQSRKNTHDKASHDIRAPVLSSPLRKQSDQKPFLSLFAGVVSLTGALVAKGAQMLCLSVWQSVWGSWGLLYMPTLMAKLKTLTLSGH